jgi:hypothetical protein
MTYGTKSSGAGGGADILATRKRNYWRPSMTFLWGKRAVGWLPGRRVGDGLGWVSFCCGDARFDASTTPPAG